MLQNRVFWIAAGGGLFGLVLAVLLLWQPPDDTQATANTVAIDQPAPNLQVETLAGEPLSLRDLRGQTVILNFWATWCVPCRAEMPALQAFAQAQENVIVLAINADAESAAAAGAFIEEVNAPDLLAALDPARSARNTYGVVSLPTTYFIDPEGIVRTVRFGEVTTEDLEGFAGFLEREAATTER